MDITTLIDSKIFIGIVSALAGIVAAVITQNWLSKRALFTYYVFHNRIGLSAEDAIYGSVKVTWNDNLVSHLYLSTVELINQSAKDFENVVVRVFTNNTLLLAHRAEIISTTRIIEFTDEYKKELVVPEGEQPTNTQLDLYHHRRDYLIPIMNRGQKVSFQYLNAADSEEQPTIWLDVLHKGVKCKFRVAQNQFLGVPQPTAALVGTLVGLIAVGFVVIYIESLPIVALLSFFLGLVVLVPGAYTVKVFRKIRDWLAG